MTTIAQHTLDLRNELPEEVILVAVSKTRSVNDILESYQVGQRHFGENRPKEMQQKATELPTDIHWHFIGHLQTNKVKYIIRDVDLIHSVDSVRLLSEIDMRAAKIDRKVDVLLQVHIAEEEQKFGFDEKELWEFFDRSEWQQFPHIRIRGLMGMATFTDQKETIRKEFSRLKRIFAEMNQLDESKKLGMSILSMGMSGDYTLAIDCGSTMIRVGSKIFGSRS